MALHLMQHRIARLPRTRFLRRSSNRMTRSSCLVSWSFRAGRLPRTETATTPKTIVRRVEPGVISTGLQLWTAQRTAILRSAHLVHLRENSSSLQNRTTWQYHTESGGESEDRSPCASMTSSTITRTAGYDSERKRAAQFAAGKKPDKRLRWQAAVNRPHAIRSPCDAGKPLQCHSLYCAELRAELAAWRQPRRGMKIRHRELVCPLLAVPSPGPRNVSPSGHARAILPPVNWGLIFGCIQFDVRRKTGSAQAICKRNAGILVRGATLERWVREIGLAHLLHAGSRRRTAGSPWGRRQRFGPTEARGTVILVTAPGSATRCRSRHQEFGRSRTCFQCGQSTFRSRIEHSSSVKSYLKGCCPRQKKMRQCAGEDRFPWRWGSE